MITLQRLVKRAHFHQMELQSSVFLRICAYLRLLVIIRDQPPLMSIYHLPLGQYGFSGHVIHLPQNVTSFSHNLPRLPPELDVLVVRKEQSQSHHDFGVRCAVVQEALQWLLENTKCLTTYSSFLFCTCLHVATLSKHAQTTSLATIYPGIQSTIARSGSPHNALHSLVYIGMARCSKVLCYSDTLFQVGTSQPKRLAESDIKARIRPGLEATVPMSDF